MRYLLAILLLIAIIGGALGHGWIWVALGLAFWPIILGIAACVLLLIFAGIVAVLDR